MSTSYELGGRSAQKARTRQALVSAARDLVAAGTTPTVEDAAEAASISRTTAYRYFPTKRALLLAAHPEIAATSMLPDDAPKGTAERLKTFIYSAGNRRDPIEAYTLFRGRLPSTKPLLQKRGLAA